MATKLYLLDTLPDYSTGHDDAKLNGSASGWISQGLSTSVGDAAVTNSIAAATVAGPTSGLEATGTGPVPLVWYSPPLAADVTISGSITWNIWASESGNSANAAINGQIEKVDGATGAITLIDKTARTTELTTSSALSNFSETPAAGVACKKGDRLRVRIFADDAGTMATGFTFTVFYDGPTAAASGDTWVQLTENLTFASEPAGTQVFPTDSASAVSTASVDREAWTSRGAGVQTDVTNTVAGFTAPIQVTDTAGGTVVDWFTRPLQAFTLGGAVRCNIRGACTATRAMHRVEVARVEGDGTGATVWATGLPYVTNGMTASEAAYSSLISGADLSVSAGQRLRIRLYLDDCGRIAMQASNTATLWYAGTSGGASGDTYLTFSQTLTEYSAVTSGSAQLTGGGVATVDDATFRTRANVGAGGGVLGVDDTTTRTTDEALTGGGVASASQQSIRTASISLTGGGVISGDARKVADDSLVATGGGVVTVAYSTTELHTLSASLTGGGVASVDDQTIRTRADASVGGGVLGASQLTIRTRAQALVGGGIASVDDLTTRTLSTSPTGGGVLGASSLRTSTGAAQATGAGIVTIDAETEEFATVSAVLTGGGVASVDDTTVRTASITATGGGSCIASGTEVASASISATGGGIATIAQAGIRPSSAASTGGGSCIPSGTKTGTSSVVATGAGVVVPSHRTIRTGAQALTGGGVLTHDYEIAGEAEEHEGSAQLTGGGIVAPSQRTIRTSSISGTGGGGVVPSQAIARVVIVTVTGGGVLAISQATLRPSSAVLTGGGAAVPSPTTIRMSSVGATGGGIVIVNGPVSVERIRIEDGPLGIRIGDEAEGRGRGEGPCRLRIWQGPERLCYAASPFRIGDPAMSTLEGKRGDTVAYRFTCLDEDDEALDLGSATADLHVRVLPDDEDAVISKSIGDGLTVVSPSSAGLLDLTLSPEDTDIEPGDYRWDLQLTIGASVFTVDEGLLSITGDITRLES